MQPHTAKEQRSLNQKGFLKKAASGVRGGSAAERAAGSMREVLTGQTLLQKSLWTPQLPAEEREAGAGEGAQAHGSELPHKNLGGRGRGQAGVSNPLCVGRICIEACKPGVSSLRSLHQLSVRLTCEALKELRLVPQGISVEAIEARHLNTFYWHSVGHLLGLDTHDTASMGYDRCVRMCVFVKRRRRGGGKGEDKGREG
eukprot:1156689-Pelagomonas_calceolata.AAC.2